MLIRTFLKRLSSKSLFLLSNSLSSFSTGRQLVDIFISFYLDRTHTVHYRGHTLTFSVPNTLCYWRVLTFDSKEPETLSWIDSFEQSSVFWDIGANIGLYSCYAALKTSATVYSVEPSVYNLSTLVRNIQLNSLQDSVILIPLALTDSPCISSLKHTSTDLGSALTTFRESYGWDGQTIRPISTYQIPGLPGNMLTTLFSQISRPDYIKIDVDGIEHIILNGLSDILRTTKSILVEVNDNFSQQSLSVSEILTSLGFQLQEKSHSDMIANNTCGFQHTYNQIWSKTLD